MKRVISLLLLCVSLSSCGIFRSVNKEKELSEVRTVVKTDSTGKLTSGKVDRSSSVASDKSVTVTERQTTKTTTRPGGDFVFRADMLRLKNGETITMDSAGNKFSVMLDKMSQTLHFGITTPDETVTEQTNERTTTSNDVSSEENRNVEETSLQETAVSTSEERLEETKKKNVEKEGKNSFWYVVMIIAIVLIIVYFVYLRTKVKR